MSDVAEAAVALTAELVAIDSVNPGLVPGAAGEAEIVRHLNARLRRTGFTTHVLESAVSGRPSLVAVGPGSSTGPTVVLNGHLDTVGAAGMPEPFTPARQGDRLSGRGAADMKGGVAAMVLAAEALAASETPLRIVLALVADEEDASSSGNPPTSSSPGRYAGSRSSASRSGAGRRTARSPPSASTRSRSSAGSPRRSTHDPRPCARAVVTSWSPSPPAATPP